MAITSADFDRVCTGDTMHIDYTDKLLPETDQELAEFPDGIDQAALRQSYAYAWAQTYGARQAQDSSRAMHVLSSASLSCSLAQLSTREVSCIGYQLSNDGQILQEVISSKTETFMLSTLETSSFQLSSSWRTMRYTNSQNAWCLLNTPGFTSYAGNYSGTNLKSTLNAMLELQEDARDLMQPSYRFFLDKDSANWLQQLDGTLLSSIQTSSTLDLLDNVLFNTLIAPHLSAADFSSLSNVLSDSMFLDLSSMSSMYKPLVQLDKTSILMRPYFQSLDRTLQCNGHWDSVEKTTDISDEYKTSADFVTDIASPTWTLWYNPQLGCPASFYKSHEHLGEYKDEDGKTHQLYRDIDSQGTAVCQVSAYVDSISAEYDNAPKLSAIDFRDTLWMKQRKTLGVRSQKLLAVTAAMKSQTWTDLSSREHIQMTADIYASLVDMQPVSAVVSATVQDAVTAEDERCMLADIASTMSHEERGQLAARIRDYQVDMPLSSTLWREDTWSKLDSPAPVWSLLASSTPALPPLRPIVKYGRSESRAWTALVGCWTVTEIDSPLAGLVDSTD